jgi:ribosomal protein S18 acetylase RimI-like enzyme
MDSPKIEPTKELTAGLVVIGVDPKFQGKGYGSLLLKEFEKKAIDMNCIRMNLTVESSNASAIRAYERNGWKKDNEKDEHISMFKIVTTQ